MRDEVHLKYSDNTFEYTTEIWLRLVVMRQLPNVRQTCTPGKRKQNIKALAALAFLLALETKVVDAE